MMRLVLHELMSSAQVVAPDDWLLHEPSHYPNGRNVCNSALEAPSPKIAVQQHKVWRPAKHSLECFQRKWDAREEVTLGSYRHHVWHDIDHHIGTISEEQQHSTCNCEYRPVRAAFEGLLCNSAATTVAADLSVLKDRDTQLKVERPKQAHTLSMLPAAAVTS
jgi:hypothetical protein